MFHSLSRANLYAEIISCLSCVTVDRALNAYVAHRIGKGGPCQEALAFTGRSSKTANSLRGSLRMALGGADVTQWAVRSSLHKVLSDACNAVVRSPIKIFWEGDVTK